MTHVRGRDAVDRALAPHTPALALVLRGLGRHDPAFAAHTAGYLAHTSFARSPLARAWLAVLAPLTDGLDVCVPDLLTLDVESANLLPALVRACSGLRLRVGWDPAVLPDGVRRWDALRNRRIGERLATHGEELAPAGNAAPVVDLPRHPADLGEEVAAWRDPPEPARLLAAMELAFASFGFSACQQLASRLPELARGPRRRRAHLLLALSAYNRQVGTKGEGEAADHALAELLACSYAEALRGETDPDVRSHLLYRLCINAARRQADLPAALPYAEEAVKVARSRAQEAWARNGMAFVLGRSGQTDAAISECERALSLLATPLAPIEELERPYARAVIVDNLVELCNRAGRFAESERWLAAVDGAIQSIPSDRALSARRGSLRPDALRALAERGLDHAEELFDPLAAEAYAVAAADGAYRCGDAAASVGLLSRYAAETPANQVALAMALLRAGRPTEAARRFAAVAAHVPAEARIEILATQGWALAVAGSAPEAEELVNAAIGDAVGLGNRDVLLRVACAAGEACLALDRPADAAAAFGQAWDLAQGDVNPADLLWILGGLLAADASESPGDLVSLALEHLEVALRDPEPWWELPRLERAMHELGLPIEGRLAEVLAARGATSR